MPVPKVHKVCKRCDQLVAVEPEEEQCPTCSGKLKETHVSLLLANSANDIWITSSGKKRKRKP